MVGFDTFRVYHLKERENTKNRIRRTFGRERNQTPENVLLCVTF